MYYPFFRGKQFELILLRDNAGFLAKNTIHPIIEPVKNDFSALKRSMKALNEKNVDCTLVVNPQAGQKPVPIDSMRKLIDSDFNNYKNISLGYMMHTKSNINDLIALVRQYKNSNFTIVHCGYSNGKQLADALGEFQNIKKHVFIEGSAGKLYQRHFKKNGIKRVLIRNGFKPQKKNSNYPPSEHFSDLHLTYSDEGVDGFGDYLMVGDDYSESGGPAYAVAIHVTYLDPENDMFIYHFISDRTDSPTDPGGKFLEALAKMIKELKKPNSPIFKSKACMEYMKLYNEKHYPGLGYVKKLSMQHHIELIAHFLEQAD